MEIETLYSYELSKKTCKELRLLAKEKGARALSKLKRNELLELLSKDEPVEVIPILQIKNPYRIASFDPAKVNFAMLVEEYERPEKIGKLPNVSRQKIVDLTLDYSTIYNGSRTILIEKVNVTGEPEKKKTKGKKTKKPKALDPVIFDNLTATLDKYENIWKECHVFVIEEQMGFGKKVNVMAIKVAQHIFTYFRLKYPAIPTLYLHAYSKVQVLLGPEGRIKGESIQEEEKPKKKGGTKKGQSKKGKKKTEGKAKYDRKKWASELAEKIWVTRKDFSTINKISKYDKRDDVSDCLIQAIAYYILTSVI